MIKKQETKHIKLLILAVGLVLLVGAGWFLIGVAYNNGKSAQKEVTNSELRQLGGAIEEKVQTLAKLSDLNAETPEQIDAEGIEKYREKLDGIIAEIKNEKAKEALTEYAEVWKGLAETYASEDNSAIATALEELRSKASDVAIRVTEAYNNSIKDAAEKLPE